MQIKTQSLAAFLFASLFYSACFGEWSHRAQAGLAFTDNANFSQTDKISDSILLLNAGTSLFENEQEINFYLGYRDYAQENHNDVLNWRLGLVRSKLFGQIGEWELDFGIGGQQYTSSQAATTEDSFNSVSAEVIALREFDLKPDLELSVEPGIILKSFSEFSGRTDWTLMTRSELKWNLRPELFIIPSAEIDLTGSSQSDYDRRAFEFGVRGQGKVNPTLSWNTGFLSKITTYQGRSVNSTILVNRGKRTVAIDQSGNERFNFFQVQGTLVKVVGVATFKGTVAQNSQTSRSETQDFTETYLAGTVGITF